MIVEHVVRVAVRWPGAHHRLELRKTLVLRVPIDEGSAKVRTGGPIDDPEDMDLPVWAGVIPLRLTQANRSRNPQQTQPLPVPVPDRSGMARSPRS